MHLNPGWQCGGWPSVGRVSAIDFSFGTVADHNSDVNERSTLIERIKS